MKVNPVAIQSYQQLNRQDRSQLRQGANAAKQPDKKVVIEPQNRMTKSALAVKGPETGYAENLSTEERQALELLFSRFRDASRYGNGNAADQTAEAGIGNVVDIKA